MIVQHAKRKHDLQETYLPENFCVIRLELAREPEHPDGSRNYGYLVWAPLDINGKIETTYWNE